MATIPYTKDVMPANMQLPKGVQVVAWLDMDASDVGAPYDCPAASRKSLQVVGTRSATAQGTNIPDSTDTFVSLTSNGTTTATTTNIVAIHEPVYRIRPSADAVTGSTVDVYLLVVTDARG